MMIDKNTKNISYPSQLAILFGLTAGGVIISVIIGIVIWLMMVGGTPPSKPEEMLQPKYYNVNMVLQGVTTFFIFFVPAYFFAIICYRRPYKFLGFNLYINLKQILLVLGILLLTFPISGALAEINKILPIPQSWELKFKAMETAREAQEAALININSLSKYLISLFMIALLPAIFEEVFFRAGMQNFFTRWFKDPWPAVILTSIIFSIIHLSFYGFIVRFGLGVILGFIFYYSGSVWLSVLFHFLFNGIQVTALYIMNVSGKKEIKDLEGSFPLWAGAICLVILLYLFKIYKEASILQQAKYVEKETPEDEFHSWATNQP